MSEEQRAEPICWSDDGLVCYVDGKGFGVTKCRTICLGKAEEVMKAHPLEGRSRKPLELKFSRQNRFSKGGISKKGGV